MTSKTMKTTIKKNAMTSRPNLYLLMQGCEFHAMAWGNSEQEAIASVAYETLPNESVSWMLANTTAINCPEHKKFLSSMSHDDICKLYENEAKFMLSVKTGF